MVFMFEYERTVRLCNACDAYDKGPFSTSYITPGWYWTVGAGEFVHYCKVCRKKKGV